MKKLLILGGSINAIQILNKAKALGIEVGVADYYEYSTCKSLADYSHNINVFDIEGVARIIHDNSYDGIITGYSEQLLMPYAEICERSGLKCYGSKALFDISTNKAKFKTVCRKYNVPVMPEYTYEEALQNGLIYPIVVKPVDSAASIGVSICKNKEEFVNNYKVALESSKSGKVIIEKCAKGFEATLFFYFHEGKPHFTAYGDKLTHKPIGKDLPLPVGYIFPGKADSVKVERFVSTISDLFEKEGFSEGMAFAQVFVEDEGIYLCEIGYRLTPSFETFIIDYYNSFNPLSSMIEYAVCNKSDYRNLLSTKPYKGFAANITFLLNPGIIAEYKGVSDIEKLPYVIKALKSWETGHEITPQQIGTLAQVGLRVLIHGDSREDLINKMDYIKELIRIEDSNSNDLVVRDYSYKNF